jgi:hypothetical protein
VKSTTTSLICFAISWNFSSNELAAISFGLTSVNQFLGTQTGLIKGQDIKSF